MHPERRIAGRDAIYAGEHVASNVAERDAMDRYAAVGPLFKPRKLPIDGLWFPASVGEDRPVKLAVDLILKGHQEQRRRLDAGSQRKQPQGGGW